ncbi:hypothetical protein RPMA_20450 [Tardiphaga alba]|uniref:DUF6321 domain-containing protein n=1 Tax=Tardiphaga alba TaxID=340268 RepID=A0ABX8AEY5_9BRAD|nr:DUF6321 domain-containing protein [Tardiphaga alba]QUS40945.1 hypothetical protein RPMA_20450 [Tardiphaga alba]
MAKSTTRKAPWKRANPRKRAGKASKHLTPAKKAAAKARAKRAGRPYPNLVDNMNMAKSAKKKTAKKTAKKAAKKTVKKKSSKKSTKKAAKKTAKKTTKKTTKKTAKKKASKKAEKDPKGGLTAAGRKAFAKKDGAHLRPGVTKKVSEMTLTEMRRKGSWAVRFYGRAKLPPLVDGEGRPTRHALSAHAWGEPVPKTVAAARKIAAKGERLLERYRAAKARA